MAGLADIVRSAVRIANSVTGTLQTQINHAAVARNSDGSVALGRSGQPSSWNSPTPRKAIIESRQELRRAVDGIEKMSRYKVTLLESAPVHHLDKFTFTNGEVFPPVLAIGAQLDDAAAPYITEIWF